MPLIDVLRVIIACALLFVSVQRGWLLRVTNLVQRLAPLVIPELEAHDVELHGLLVADLRGDALHH